MRCFMLSVATPAHYDDSIVAVDCVGRNVQESRDVNTCVGYWEAVWCNHLV